MQTVTKKIRFDVFKRDRFACQYCGRTPPAVTLECDHVIPISKGGGSSIENLVTSCFDCNRGKSSRSLDSLPRSLVELSAEAKEKRAQLAAYNRLLRKISDESEEAIERVRREFTKAFPEHELVDSFCQSSIKTVFLAKLPAEEVVEAMKLACARTQEPGRATKYFCGICWKIIRGRGF